MKKIFLLILGTAAAFAISACGNAGESEAAEVAETSRAAVESEAAGGSEADEGADEGEPSGVSGTGNVLVAYFSWADNAILAEDVDTVASPSVIPPGNVQQLAQWVQEETGGDLFSIRITDPYPSDWDECLERANQERGDDARPQLVENVENMDQYDTVFLGYPNWWYGVPMALMSFLESNDFTGKQVYLFCSHGTGGLARSVDIISEAIPDAAISDNIFDCYEEDAASSQEAIQSWAAGQGFSGAGNEQEAESEEISVASEQISVQCREIEIIYELNGSSAAAALLEQLPLTLEVEDFSTNEKIFYPPEELDTSDAPLAEGGAETLAYYAPWGDVVMFYDDYGANSSLYELGEAVSGAEQIGQLSGTVTIDIAGSAEQ